MDGAMVIHIFAYALPRVAPDSTQSDYLKLAGSVTPAVFAAGDLPRFRKRRGGFRACLGQRIGR
jgi:hypothetical protein